MPNVFVLCTGRNGSVTLAKACAHLTNYTSGHETRCRVLGEARVDYPENHIEVDNRLSFFLGALEKKYGDDAIYIHLRREPDAVARSYNTRWHVAEGIMKGWAVGLARQTQFGVNTARFMVDTIEENITAFLRDKSKVMVINLETLQDQLPAFLDLIGAEGDLKAALAAVSETHNASTSIPQSDDSNLSPEQSSLKTLEYMVDLINDQRKKLSSATRDQLKLREVQGQLKDKTVLAKDLARENRKLNKELLILQHPRSLVKVLARLLVPLSVKKSLKLFLGARRPKRVATAEVSAITQQECLELVQGSADPIRTVNVLLAGGHLDNKVAGQIIRTIFSNRDPSFLLLSKSSNVVESQALDALIRLYKSEYQGVTYDSEMLRQQWDLIAETSYELVLKDKHYFLLAAIKSESIDLVDRMLSQFLDLDPTKLPSTFKTGILRLVINQSPGSYNQWRDRLELSELQILQNAELDREMGVENACSHAEYPARLSAVVPTSLHGELKTSILPFFEKNVAQLVWMDCRLDQAVRDAFVASIGANLTSKTPWSLIRLGDGESYAWQDDFPEEHAAMRELIWWGTKLEKPLRDEIAGKILGAIQSADVLGIPSLYRFARDTDENLKSYSTHRSISGLLRVLNGVDHLPPSERLFTEDRIHQICFDISTVLELGRRASKMVVVSSVVPEAIADCLSPLEGYTSVEFVQVPTHTKSQGNALFSTSDVALPFIYEDINAEISGKVDPGTLVIIASGAIGKIFCETVRQRGGVALDVGAMVDYWVGVKTRSVADMI